MMSSAVWQRSNVSCILAKILGSRIGSISFILLWSWSAPALDSAPVSRTVHLALAAVTAFFVLLPLPLGKPGLPTHLKADEAAYYLAAQSLAYDRDLKVEPKDVDRAFQEFPFSPVANVIVMSD